MNAIISVIGQDRVGILAMVANECSNFNLNIEDVSQTIVNGMFTMTMSYMEQKGKEQNLEIRVMHQDIFNSMHRI